MLADLHVHTFFSDSTRSPEEAARKARACGLGLIAICDHNTVDAHQRMRAACAAEGLLFLPGAELEAAFETGEQHILAYGCDFSSPPLQALLRENLRIMEQVSIDLIQRMQEDDPRLNPLEYASFERNPSRGGWKGIDYLRTKGYDISYPACMVFYKRYGCRPGAFRSVEEVTGLIHAAGGLAVLAHPGDRLAAEGFGEHLQALRTSGIDGIECYYPSHSAAITDACVTFCQRHDMLVTAGSDDHGTFAEWMDGVHYALGKMRIETSALYLKGLY